MMFKVIILGDTAVGKSCLLLRYCDAKYQSTHVPTVGKNTIKFKESLYFQENQIIDHNVMVIFKKKKVSISK